MNRAIVAIVRHAAHQIAICIENWALEEKATSSREIESLLSRQICLKLLLQVTKVLCDSEGFVKEIYPIIEAVATVVVFSDVEGVQREVDGETSVRDGNEVKIYLPVGILVAALEKSPVSIRKMGHVGPAYLSSTSPKSRSRHRTKKS